MENIAILKKMALFADLDTLELIQISKLISNHRYTKGGMVIREGDRGSSLFAVKTGQFRAYVTRGGNQQDLAVFQSGESFGELALVDAAPRSASVEALTAGELLELTAEDFETILGYTPDLRQKIHENLIRDLVLKLRRTNDRLLHLL
jgi:CRP-like cAMP-binding protein